MFCIPAASPKSSDYIVPCGYIQVFAIDRKALARSNINQIFDNMVKLLHASLIFGVGVVRVAFKERLSKELSARVCLFRLLLLSSPWLQDLHWEEERWKRFMFRLHCQGLPTASSFLWGATINSGGRKVSRDNYNEGGVGVTLQRIHFKSHQQSSFLI